MDDKKNENEKVMKYINGKLKDGEIPLMLQDIAMYNKSSAEQGKLVITSSSLYFIFSLSVKRYIKAMLIECVALTPFSNQMVVFYDPKGDQSTKESVRFESEASFKIIQDIISVRERFCEMNQLLPVMVCQSKSLENIANANQNTNKNKFFGFLFKKKESIKDLQQRLSGQGDLLYVSQKNFALEIGEKMYNQIYKNVKLLYISNTESFRFFEQKYDIQEINPSKKIFRLKKQQSQKQKSRNSSSSTKQQNRKNILMRKIGKKSPHEDKIVAEALRKYKNEQYKEEVLFAIETETHFEVLTAFQEGERDCQSLLREHEFLSEKDLRSIFFKLVEMTESSQQVFASLSPENIIVGRHGFRISKIFSCLTRRSQVDYLAPQQLTQDKFTPQEVQLLNFWKAGILLYELAYGNVPFAIEYIAKLIMEGKKQIEFNFPFYSLRTQEFQIFIKSVLKIDPKERGIPIEKSSEDRQKLQKQIGQQKWKTSIMQSVWIK